MSGQNKAIDIIITRETIEEIVKARWGNAKYAVDLMKTELDTEQLRIAVILKAFEKVLLAKGINPQFSLEEIL